MITPANTYVTVYRGTELNYAGDEVDIDTPLTADLVGYIAEMGRSSTNYSDSMPRTVRRYVGRFDVRADIRLGDRIEDQTTGMIFTVENVSSARRGMFESDLRAELKRLN